MIGSMLYKLILGPLELLFDIVYSKAFQMILDPGLSIIILSLAINFLVLPLYRRADAIQEEERQQAIRMKPGVDHIKKVFKGDERFMILQTFYRQNHYKPYYALKGSLSLLLEIPFFIAAYNFLSGLQLLHGASLGPIADLGKPDQLIRIGGFTINLLPILMTGINIVSGAIYTKGMPLKSKIQLYGMALIFLFLLYDSPSGLVFYWTLNNLFSLGKNLFFKLRNPKLVFFSLCSAAGLCLLPIFYFFHPLNGLRRQLLLMIIVVLMQLPLLIYLYRRKHPESEVPENTAADKVIFYAGCVFMTILTGILIPSAVIKAAPAEFVDLYAYQTPMYYILNSLLLAAGTFLIWFVVFYKFSTPKAKRIFSLMLGAAVIVSAINFMFFGKDYGNMSSLIRYDNQIHNSTQAYLINSAAVVAATGIVYLIWKKKRALLRAMCIAGCLAVSVLSVSNAVSIQQQETELKAQASRISDVQPNIVLDKTGKNVIVLMMDRAINRYLPFLMQEHPELQKQLTGFTIRFPMGRLRMSEHRRFSGDMIIRRSISTKGRTSC